jgi:hypothetical protein
MAQSPQGSGKLEPFLSPLKVRVKQLVYVNPKQLRAPDSHLHVFRASLHAWSLLFAPRLLAVLSVGVTLAREGSIGQVVEDFLVDDATYRNVARAHRRNHSMVNDLNVTWRKLGPGL